MPLQWPSLQCRSTDFPVVFALFLLLKLNCAYKQVSSDLLNHSDHKTTRCAATELIGIRWRSSFVMVNTHLVMQERHPTAALMAWWKPVPPHNMPSKSLGGTGQRKLIYKVQSKNKDQCFLGERKAHRLISAGLYSDTPLKKQKCNDCYTHKTPFSTLYLRPTTAPSTLEKILSSQCQNTALYLQWISTNLHQ